jgi:hypothetical protein
LANGLHTFIFVTVDAGDDEEGWTGHSAHHRQGMEYEHSPQIMDEEEPESFPQTR